jgi:hypothetical protein
MSATVRTSSLSSLMSVHTLETGTMMDRLLSIKSPVINSTTSRFTQKAHIFFCHQTVTACPASYCKFHQSACVTHNSSFHLSFAVSQVQLKHPLALLAYVLATFLLQCSYINSRWSAHHAYSNDQLPGFTAVLFVVLNSILILRMADAALYQVN